MYNFYSGQSICLRRSVVFIPFFTSRLRRKKKQQQQTHTKWKKINNNGPAINVTLTIHVVIKAKEMKHKIYMSKYLSIYFGDILITHIMSSELVVTSPTRFTMFYLFFVVVSFNDKCYFDFSCSKCIENA